MTKQGEYHSFTQAKAFQASRLKAAAKKIINWKGRKAHSYQAACEEFANLVVAYMQ